MSEQQTQKAPGGDLSPEELALRRSGGVIAMVESIRKKERDKNEAEMIEALALLAAPDRETVPELYRHTEPHRGSVQTASPTDPLYRRMSDEVQEWRNPDSDHWMAEWVRGCYSGDHAKQLVASAKLEEIYPRAVMTEGTAGTGGAVSTGTGGELIPRPLEAVVMIARDRIAKMRRFATIFLMTRQQHNIPTAGAITAAMVAESTSGADSSPAIAQVPLVAHVAAAKASTTKELMEDAAINLINIIATRGGGALGVLEDNQFFRLGSGTAPNVTKISGTAFAVNTGTDLAYSDLLTMVSNVGQQYRDAGVFFIAADVLNFLANVRDGNGRPFYQGLQETPAPIGDDPGIVGTILRKPVFEVPFTAGEIWFGDPAQYALGNRQGIQMAASEHVRFLEREIVWILTERIAGNNTDAAAAQVETAVASASSL